MSERVPKPFENGPDRWKGALWLFALIFLAYSLRPAWSWVQESWYEMNNAAPTWADRGAWAVKEVGPLALALCLMAILWKFLGSPFSFQRGVSHEPARRVAPSERQAGDELEPPELELTQPRARSREAGPGGESRTMAIPGVGSPLWVALWTLVSFLIVASAGWALLCVACASQASGWPMTEAKDSVILTWGLVSIGVALFLALVVWIVVGPPFRRTEK